jgi:DNA-3-methyladenine glycosylase II
VFQQISIHAASSIMGRLVHSLGTAVEADGTRIVAFPAPRTLLHADDTVLTAAGLSTNKRMHLRSVADAIESGEVTQHEIEMLSTSKASEKLVQMRGIGPWSAAVVLLRGFGRLDTFPMRDSGVARTIIDLSGNPKVDLDETLVTLGPVKGMLYYHLLLGRLRNLEA